jgi:aminoglycoside 2'-N-acetyltransferase I
MSPPPLVPTMPGVDAVTLAHTGQLDPATLASARALLDEAFGGDFTDADWEHSLGGMHALVFDGAQMIGHGAVVQRRMLHGGRALRVGYVEAVAVAAAHRRRGHAAALMATLEGIIRRAYDAGALSSSGEGAVLYAGRGWQRWRGPTSVLTPAGTRRTPEEDGSAFVLPVTADLDLTGELTCDWRDGAVW